MRIGRPFLDLDGAVVVVTGASSGIGRATAHRLAARNARLVLAARGIDALDETVAECRSLGAEAIAAIADVGDATAVAELARAAERRFGRIDAWVSNAGVMAYGRFSKVPVEVHRRVIETNLLGVMHGAAEAIPRFLRTGRGVLVNVGSLYGEMTTPYVGAYATSKFAVLGFSRVLQRDLRPQDRIKVCCVMPGSVDTPIFRHAANFHGRRVRALAPVSDPDRVARAVQRCLEHPRKEVRVGYLDRVFAQGERFLPPVYDRLVNPVMGRIGFTREEVATDLGNLFEPAREWQQVDGEWRNTTARRASMVAVAAAGAAALAARGRHDT